MVIKTIVPTHGDIFALYTNKNNANPIYETVLLWAVIKDLNGGDSVVGLIYSDGGIVNAEEPSNFLGYHFGPRESTA